MRVRCPEAESDASPCETEQRNSPDAEGGSETDDLADGFAHYWREELPQKEHARQPTKRPSPDIGRNSGGDPCAHVRREQADSHADDS